MKILLIFIALSQLVAVPFGHITVESHDEDVSLSFMFLYTGGGDRFAYVPGLYNAVTAEFRPWRNVLVPADALPRLAGDRSTSVGGRIFPPNAAHPSEPIDPPDPTFIELATQKGKPKRYGVGLFLEEEKVFLRFQGLVLEQSPSHGAAEAGNSVIREVDVGVVVIPLPPQYADYAVSLLAEERDALLPDLIATGPAVSVIPSKPIAREDIVQARKSARKSD